MGLRHQKFLKAPRGRFTPRPCIQNVVRDQLGAYWKGTLPSPSPDPLSRQVDIDKTPGDLCTHSTALLQRLLTRPALTVSSFVIQAPVFAGHQVLLVISTHRQEFTPLWKIGSPWAHQTGYRNMPLAKPFKKFVQ